MFSLRHILHQSISQHGLTIPGSLHLFSHLYLPHPSLAHISSFLIFSILCIPITRLNMLIHVISSNINSAFLSDHVSLPYIITCMMVVLNTAVSSIIGILLSHTIPDICRHVPHPAPTRFRFGSCRGCQVWCSVRWRSVRHRWYSSFQRRMVETSRRVSRR